MVTEWECTWSAEELQGKDETVQLLEQGLSAPERVAAAVQSLPPYTATKSASDGGEHRQFQYATIRDYAHAYSSGRLTPTQVLQSVASWMLLAQSKISQTPTGAPPSVLRTSSRVQCSQVVQRGTNCYRLCHVIIVALILSKWTGITICNNNESFEREK